MWCKVPSETSVPKAKTKSKWKQIQLGKMNFDCINYKMNCKYINYSMHAQIKCILQQFAHIYNHKNKLFSVILYMIYNIDTYNVVCKKNYLNLKMYITTESIFPAFIAHRHNCNSFWWPCKWRITIMDLYTTVSILICNSTQV